MERERDRQTDRQTRRERKENASGKGLFFFLRNRLGKDLTVGVGSSKVFWWEES